MLRSPRFLSDLNGAVRLATDAVLGVTDLVEASHQAVWTVLGVPARVPGRTRGLTGHIYAAVRGTTHLVGHGAALAVDAAAEPSDVENPRLSVPTLRAVLNGVVGDYLSATGNPLATPMSLHVRGRPLVCESSLEAEEAPELFGVPESFDVPEATSRIALLVHGLCMDERAWDAAAQHEPEGSSHAEALEARGYTPVRVRYNTGRSIAENGRRLARLLSALCARWPAPVDEIAVVAHSMGGLVVRSALHHADALGCDAALGWRPYLRRVVCLGTPHHGAPLERLGGWVDAVLDLSPFTAPYARIGAVRSAGITDLRWGRVAGRVAPIPLPTDIAWYAIAGTLGDSVDEPAAPSPPGDSLGSRSWVETLVGDGLVPVASALGEDSRSDASLDIRASHRQLVTETGHLALLRSPEVTAWLVRWLGPTWGAVSVR
ncbi:MAG: alpha/beta hydrolase [Bacteroidota bacterium]